MQTSEKQYLAKTIHVKTSACHSARYKNALVSFCAKNHLPRKKLPFARVWILFGAKVKAGSKNTPPLRCECQKIIYYICRADRTAEPRSGVRVAGCEYNIRKRLSALVLDGWEFSQNSYQGQGCSNGRCPWYVNLALFRLCKKPGALSRFTYNMRGLLQLPSDFDRAMREASNRRTVTDTDSYAFSFQLFNADERGPEARRIKNECNFDGCFRDKLHFCFWHSYVCQK